MVAWGLVMFRNAVSGLLVAGLVTLVISMIEVVLDGFSSYFIGEILLGVFCLLLAAALHLADRNGGGKQ